MPDHTKLYVTSLAVALVPGCDRSWMDWTDWNNFSCRGDGIYDQRVAADGDRGAGNLLLLEPQGGGWHQKCSEFVVAIMRYVQCVVGWWCSDGIDTKKSASENVLSRDVSYIDRGLG
jgi:hypothetical protein